MKHIKPFCLIVAAAVAAMAFVGVSPAMAEESTALCMAHEVPCAEENQVSTFKALATNTLLESSVATVLCLHAEATAEVEEPALATAPEPLGVKITEQAFTECGTNAEHNNCTITNLELPLGDVLKTELNLATVKGLNAEVNVKCGFIINCTYSETVKPLILEGAEHTKGAGNGMLTAEEVEIAKGKGFLCPEIVQWTALFEPEEPIYIVS